MSSNSGGRSGGTGLLGLLGLMFIGLKLGGVIHWSWFWVTAPLWGPFAIALAVSGLAAMVLGVVAIADRK